MHVQIKPEDVKGYALKTVSDLLPEDVQTIPKSVVSEEMGYIATDSEVMSKINTALIMQLGVNLSSEEDAELEVNP